MKILDYYKFTCQINFINVIKKCLSSGTWLPFDKVIKLVATVVKTIPQLYVNFAYTF